MTPQGQPPPAAAAAARARVEALVARARTPRLGGVWTLFVKEVRRFWNTAGQTIGSPVVTTLLYFVVFGTSLGDRLRAIDGVPYVSYIVPGLVMLGVINNAFINSAFSLFLTKIQGTLVDVLVSPLTPGQILLAYVAASMLRALLVGAIIWLVAGLMGAETLANLPLTLLFLILTASLFATLGVVIAIHARDFNHINLLPSFLITPLTFLGGVFYSVDMLPAPWDTVSRWNPILYVVDGLRAGMVGHSDVAPWAGALLLTTANLGLGAYAWALLRSGRKLRE